MELRRRSIESAQEFIRAQRAYIDTIAPGSGRSEANSQALVESYLAVAEPYETALQELRQYLLASEQSDAVLSELERTERLIKTLNREKRIGSRLIERHEESERVDSD
jgi:hypothetical protein